MRLNEDFTRRGKLADLGRWHVTRFVERIARNLPAGARLLDAGAGECAYKRFFPHCRYVATDSTVGEAAWNYLNLDMLSVLDRLPLADGGFDAVLCTQVLEHVERPREVVAELRRVLAPGGTLYLTAPMAHAEHQAPHDFFRYTSFGLRSLCAEAGFREIEVAPFGGVFTRWAYELPRALEAIPGGLAWAPVRLAGLAGVRAAQSLLLLGERLDRRRDDPFGWSVVARR